MQIHCWGRYLLKLRIEEQHPDIIAITELLPKYSTKESVFQNEEFQLQGYQHFFGRNDKRGVMISIGNHLKAIRMEGITDHKHEEQVWCRIELHCNKTLTIGCIYHSPSSNREDHEDLLDLINQVGRNAGEHNHLVILGDFNFPDIDWSTWNAASTQSTKLIDTLQDNFMYQHVAQPTRYRHGQSPTLDDLILSDKEELIEGVTYADALGKSDHLVLSFNIMLEPDLTGKTKERFKMEKGDYDKMRNSMREENWEALMAGKELNEMWNLFTSKYARAVNECIPKYKMTPRKWNRPLWMNRNALRKVRKKYWAWKRYTLTGSSNEYEKYIKARSAAKKECWTLRREFEKMIAKEAKYNPKAFWSYIKNQTKSSQGVSPLEKQDGELTNKDIEKAEVLNSFFASVFTKEDLSNVPTLASRGYDQPLGTVTITQEDVLKRIRKLKPNKSSGPDDIHPRILREIKEEVALPL
jgi:endonuclease/exonuclease/phosphatase family metal-dependent hydrolase